MKSVTTTRRIVASRLTVILLHAGRAVNIVSVCVRSYSQSLQDTNPETHVVAPVQPIPPPASRFRSAATIVTKQVGTYTGPTPAAERRRDARRPPTQTPQGQVLRTLSELFVSNRCNAAQSSEAESLQKGSIALFPEYIRTAKDDARTKCVPSDLSTVHPRNRPCTHATLDCASRTHHHILTTAQETS